MTTTGARTGKLPIAPEAADRFGRCDLIVLRGAAPDVVVELDSAPHAAKEEKLRFAAEAGAIAARVRWRAGAVATPEGVHICGCGGTEQALGLTTSQLV